MRIRLNFICSEEENLLPGEYKKIVFPVDSSKIYKVKDLKRSIQSFISRISGDLSVEYLFLGNFLLFDDFDISEVLSNDDEIRVTLNKEINTGGKSKKINTSIKKKKMTVVDVDSIEEDSEKNEDESLVDNKVRKVNSSTKKAKKNEKIKTISKIKTNFKANSEDSSDSEDIVDKKQKDSNKYNFPTKQEGFLGKKKYPIYNEYKEDEKSNNKKTSSNNFNYNNSTPSTKNTAKSITNVNPNFAKFTKSENPLNKFLKSSEKLDLAKIDSQYDQVPTLKLEDVEFLKSNFPILFNKETNILLRVYELSSETGGPSISDYKKGRVEEYFSESKSFLIKVEGNSETNENLIGMYGSYDNSEGLNEEHTIINVHLKDFIELRIEKSPLNNTNFTIEKKQEERKEIIQVNEKSTNNMESKVTTINKNTTIIAPEVNSKLNSSQKVNIFNKIVLPHIKKQVEYYFSDKNYYTDSFLREKSSLNEGNYIDIEIIMGFNKIRSMSTNKQDFIDALNDSKIVEFNDDKTKIRKRNINVEFLK